MILTRPDQTLQGIIIIVLSVMAMALGDASVKAFSGDLTVWQIFFARSLFGALCLFALASLWRKPLRLISSKWVLLRSALLVLTWLAYYAALPQLTLSIAAVAVYTNPILTTLLTAAVLRERVSPLQWLGVLLGFIGVAVILRPGTDDFSWLVLFPLLAAVFYSCAMVLTRSKCQDEAPMALALWLHGSFIVTGLAVTLLISQLNIAEPIATAYPFVLGNWMPMGGSDWAIMALLGALSAGYFLGIARAYQIAPPQIIGTFDYAYLISAVLWGYLFFAETPDAYTLIGMILITAAGLLVALRRRV